MIHLVLRTGLLDATLLAAMAACLWNLRPVRIPRVIALAATLLLWFGVVGHLGIGLYRAYAVPRDVMQDIVAAQEFQAGRPMHPADMSDRIRRALENEGERPSLLAWSPELAAREREQRELMLHEHWVQAHPPGMTLFTVPFVSLFGVLGTQIAFAVLAVLSLAYTLRELRRELWPTAQGVMPFAVALGVFGWDPVVDVVRLEQPGLLLVGLLTAAWASIRRKREGVAGVFVAAAVSLKLIPGLLLVPLLAHYRRAFASAVLALVFIGVFVLLVVPLSDIAEYRQTADGVVEEYAAYPGNISLLGTYARAARTMDLSLSAAKLAWGATGALLVAGLFWGSMRLPNTQAATDRAFALGMAAIPLLSPIAWDHYLVFLILPVAVLGHHIFTRQCHRGRRVGFWILIAALAVPDHAYLWIFDMLHDSGLLWLEVGIFEPLRTALMVILLGWLVLMSESK